MATGTGGFAEILASPSSGWIEKARPHHIYWHNANILRG